MTSSSSIYLLYGRDSFLKQEFVRSFSSQYFQNPESTRLNSQTFHASDNSLSAFLAYIQTRSFFDEKKLALFWQIDELGEENHPKLISALSNLPQTCVVILESIQANFKKDNFLSSLAKIAKTIACHTPFETDLPRWLKNRATRYKKELSHASCQTLLDHCGKDLGILSTSLEQLCVFIAERPTIEVEDIEKLLGRSTQGDVFLLMDHILNRQPKQALWLVGDMLKSGKRALEIAGVLESQWEKLRKAVFLHQSGISFVEIGTLLKVPSFFQEKFIGQIQKASQFSLEKIFQELSACDEALKKGTLSERLALDRLVLTQLILTS